MVGERENGSEVLSIQQLCKLKELKSDLNYLYNKKFINVFIS